MPDFFHRLPHKYQRLQDWIADDSLWSRFASCPGQFDRQDLLWLMGAYMATKQTLDLIARKTGGNGSA